ncbi:MAG: hypothetical protein JSR77_15085 [Planctomycetes bacterium]|nr:hypothetical protein [Planctomycetota bacterium]
MSKSHPAKQTSDTPAPPTAAPADPYIPSMKPSCARVVFKIAEQLERDENRVKRTVLELAQAGDTRTIIEIVTLWIEGPCSAVVQRFCMQKDAPDTVGTAKTGQ